MLARLMSDTSTAREKHLYGSRATLAILAGVAGNTRGLCLPNPWALQAKPDGIACKTRQHCLLRRLTTDVTPLK